MTRCSRSPDASAHGAAVPENDAPAPAGDPQDDPQRPLEGEWPTKRTIVAAASISSSGGTSAIRFSTCSMRRTAMRAAAGETKRRSPRRRWPSWNSEFALDAARHLAGRVIARAGGEAPADIVRTAHRYALGREASEEEVASGIAFLTSARETAVPLLEQDDATEGASRPVATRRESGPAARCRRRNGCGDVAALPFALQSQRVRLRRLKTRVFVQTSSRRTFRGGAANVGSPRFDSASHRTASCIYLAMRRDASQSDVVVERRRAARRERFGRTGST